MGEIIKQLTIKIGTKCYKDVIVDARFKETNDKESLKLIHREGDKKAAAHYPQKGNSVK